VRAGRFDLRDAPPELNTALASAVLAPTRIYVRPVLNLLRDFTLHGLVHVTGGGFDGNVPRVLPRGVRARIDPASWPRPPIFGFLQRHGEVSEAEMLRVFNCGIGMILVVPRKDAQDVRERLNGMGERAYEIGVVERKTRETDAPILYQGAESRAG
jgi:phosphoribosylformylglycinamidine cyclo-ligase